MRDPKSHFPTSLRRLDDGVAPRILAGLVFILFITGFVMQSVQWFSAVPGDLGDPRLNSYFLEHVWIWMSGAKVSLWSPAFFYPFDNILGFSDNHFGSVLFYALFRFFGWSREYAFDAWFVCGAILNFAASYWVLKQWRLHTIACAFGAFIFAAALPVLMADNTAQLNYRFAIPLAWFFCYQGLRQELAHQRVWYFGLLAMCIAQQFLSSVYLGLLLVYCLTALGIAWWWVTRHTTLSGAHQYQYNSTKRSKNVLGWMLIVLASAMTLALLWQYHRIARQYGLTRDHEQVLSMLPTLSSYVLSDRSWIASWWSSNLGYFAQRQENQLFIGLGPIFFLAIGLYFCVRSKFAQRLLPDGLSQIGKMALLSSAIVWLITLQVFGYSLYALLIQVPGISAIRSVGRVMLVMLFPISIVVAIAVHAWQEWLIRKIPSAKSIFIVFLTWLLPAMVLLPESLMARHDTTPISAWQVRMQQMKMLLPPSLQPDAILFVPRQGAQLAWAGELDGMLIAQDLGYPTLNGYSGSLPPGITDLGVSALSRLQAYANMTHQSTQWVAEQLRRVVTLKNNLSWLQQQGAQTAWGQTIATNSEKPSNQIFLVQGWALPEPWGTWIEGHHAELLIPLPTTTKDATKGTTKNSSPIQELVLNLRPLVNAAHPQLRASYQVNGKAPQTIVWQWPQGALEPVRIAITPDDLAKGYLAITWQIDNPVPPKSIGMGEDTRVLGLGLESMTLK